MEQFSRSIEKAHIRIKPYIHMTPVFSSNSLNTCFGKKYHFKCENFQKTGSFKARGALNATLALSDRSNIQSVGLVTHSSGNHGQALAYTAQRLGIPCTIVAPSNTSKAKIDAMKGYDATVIECAPTMSARHTEYDLSFVSTVFMVYLYLYYVLRHNRLSILAVRHHGDHRLVVKTILPTILKVCRVEACNCLLKEPGNILIHAHDNMDVMAGQGTVAIEFLEQVPQLDAILVPVGGGGLAAGVSSWVRSNKPDCHGASNFILYYMFISNRMAAWYLHRPNDILVYCVEPMGKRLAESLHQGEQQFDELDYIDTLADGLRVRCIGSQCFPIIKKHCEKTVFTVNDHQIIAAMKLTWQRLKVVIEPSTAAVVAAALSDEFRQLPHEHVGVVLCGGNVDFDDLPW